MFTVETVDPTQLTLRIRVPSWVAGSATVKINSKPSEVSASPGSYLSIGRVWSAGDRIEVSLPMSLHTESMADDHSLRAFLYGPLVLAGNLGRAGLTEELVNGPEGPELKKASPMAIPEFIAPGKNLHEWIKPGDRPMSFQTTGQAVNVAFEPFYKIIRDRYSLYWKVTS